LAGDGRNQARSPESGARSLPRSLAHARKLIVLPAEVEIIMTAPGTLHTNPFTTDCSRQANQVSLRVSGRLVDPNRPITGWKTCLERLAGADVRIDMASVTEIDARGLGMLAELTRETRNAGGRVAVVGASPRVRRLLTLTHLDALLNDGGVGPRKAA